MWVVYKEIYHPFASEMIIGYVAFLLISFMSFLVLVSINFIKSKRGEKRNRLLLFLKIYLVYFALRSIYKLIFASGDFSVDDFLLPIIVSLGVTFSDLIFNDKQRVT